MSSRPKRKRARRERERLEAQLRAVRVYDPAHMTVTIAGLTFSQNEPVSFEPLPRGALDDIGRYHDCVIRTMLEAIGVGARDEALDAISEDLYGVPRVEG